MVKIIKKIAFILGVGCFFVIFLMGIDAGNLFDPETLTVAFFKGLCGGIAFWFSGFIIGDIIIKGIIHDIQEKQNDELEGGFLKRFHDVKAAENTKMLKDKNKPGVEVAEKVKK